MASTSSNLIQIPDRSNPKLDSLVEGWIGHFWSMDHQLLWTTTEREVAYWLDSKTLLAGRIDAEGKRGIEGFFADWKTANPRKKKTWRATWRKSIQALTYGTLMREMDAFRRLFLVRVAFKDNTYDQEWFEYDDAELDMWLAQCRDAAAEIRAWRSTRSGPWPLNFDNCFRYGIDYQCPHFQNGCDQLMWGNRKGLIRREPHLAVEQQMSGMAANDPEFVLLDASRLEEWFACHEKFRKEYEENIREEPGEALTFGLDFHKLMNVYYAKLITGKL